MKTADGLFIAFITIVMVSLAALSCCREIPAGPSDVVYGTSIGIAPRMREVNVQGHKVWLAHGGGLIHSPACPCLEGGAP